jgi:hypothetical protein
LGKLLIDKYSRKIKKSNKMKRNMRVLLGTGLGIMLVMATAIPALAAGPVGAGDLNQDRLRTKDCTSSVDCTQNQLRLHDQDCTGDKIKDRTRLQDRTFSGDFIRQQLRLKDRTC